MVNLEDFDFPLEESRIARYPAKERDLSKLMVVDRKSGNIILEPSFRNIEKHLDPGDAIFFNETKVSPRRVFLRGGKDHSRIFEAIFLEKIPPSWKCILKNAKKCKIGDRFLSPSGNFNFYLEAREDEFAMLTPNPEVDEDFFENEGSIPIPPYLKRQAEDLDRERYQTIFATKPGSVASPTAGLHMTTVLKEKLIQKGIRFHPLLLEIGYGTFQPLREKNLQEKKLHKERIRIPKETLAAHREMTNSSSRRIALGTTTLRALETCFRSGILDFEKDWEGETELFLHPGDKIDTIDGLITNFHLPKSSLLLLVAAFAGIELTKSSYKIALEKDFRFFSYGDAMFIK